MWWGRLAGASASCSASLGATASMRQTSSPGRSRASASSRTRRDASTAPCSDVKGSALVVSQFTLIADSKRQKGTRPDFSGAAPASEAEPLYERFCAGLRGHGVEVQTGRFGARMGVEISNDGPVTIVLDV